jgi:hypothetical protein
MLLPLFFLAILSPSFPAATAHADDESGSDAGRLTVPWTEFKKLLDLEEDQIVLSLSTFQKLLAQTGPMSTPPHTVQGGKVRLTRQAFQQLVGAMKPPLTAGATPPFDYLITKAVYSGRMQQRNTVFTGTFHVHVLKSDVYLKVPVLPQQLALENIKVDDRQALVVRESGYHQVVLSSPGEHVVVASFSVKSSVAGGPQKIDLAIRETPITLLRLELPLEDIEVEIPQAQQLVTTPGEGKTIVSAVMAPGSNLSVRWRDEVAVAEKIPAKLYSEVQSIVSIEDDVLKLTSDITYNILHSEVDAVSLLIPEEMNVLSIVGQGVGEWQEIPSGDANRILVPFTYGRKGTVSVRVVAEKPFSDKLSATAFSGVRTLDTVRETGFVGIEVKTSAEVTITESVGLETIGVPKLPQALHARAVKPLMHGFKYLKHPHHLTLSIKKHEKVSVPIATIASANAVTLFTEDGKVVHRLVYQVKNSAKQFLEIEIPEKADIWTVFVDNQPVESAVNSEGKLLVPLIRSRVVNSSLTSFPIEVVYCLVQDRFSAVDVREAGLPPVDLLTGQLIWSVYLPNDYRYFHFSSTLEKEEIIRSLNVLANVQRRYDQKVMKEVYESRQSEPSSADLRVGAAYKGEHYKSRFRNLALGDEQLESQVDAEMAFGSRLEGLAQGQVAGAPHGGLAPAGTGVLPIQIRVPTGGQVYRFARTIVRPEDELTMSVTYGASWVISLAKWVALVIVLWIIYLNRNKLAGGLRRVKGWVESVVEAGRSHEATARRVAESIMTPALLIGLLLPSWLVSADLTALVLILLWLSVIYQVVFRLRRRARNRNGVRGTEHPGTVGEAPSTPVG